eukprot:gene12950-biopygen456
MGPEVGSVSQQRSRRSFSSFLASVSQFSQFVTGGSKRLGKSCLRAAIRTAPGARSGRANDMGLFHDTLDTVFPQSRRTAARVPGINDTVGSRKQSSFPTSVSGPP